LDLGNFFAFIGAFDPAKLKTGLAIRRPSLAILGVRLPKALSGAVNCQEVDCKHSCRARAAFELEASLRLTLAFFFGFSLSLRNSEINSSISFILRRNAPKYAPLKRSSSFRNTRTSC